MDKLIHETILPIYIVGGIPHFQTHPYMVLLTIRNVLRNVLRYLAENYCNIGIDRWRKRKHECFEICWNQYLCWFDWFAGISVRSVAAAFWWKTISFAPQNAKNVQKLSNTPHQTFHWTRASKDMPSSRVVYPHVTTLCPLDVAGAAQIDGAQYQQLLHCNLA